MTLRWGGFNFKWFSWIFMIRNKSAENENTVPTAQRTWDDESMLSWRYCCCNVRMMTSSRRSLGMVRIWEQCFVPSLPLCLHVLCVNLPNNLPTSSHHHPMRRE